MMSGEHTQTIHWKAIQKQLHKNHGWTRNNVVTGNFRISDLFTNKRIYTNTQLFGTDSDYRNTHSMEITTEGWGKNRRGRATYNFSYTLPQTGVTQEQTVIISDSHSIQNPYLKSGDSIYFIPAPSKPIALVENIHQQTGKKQMYENIKSYFNDTGLLRRVVIFEAAPNEQFWIFTYEHYVEKASHYLSEIGLKNAGHQRLLHQPTIENLVRNIEDVLPKSPIEGLQFSPVEETQVY